MLRSATGILSVLTMAILSPLAAYGQNSGDNRPVAAAEIKFVMHRVGNFRSEACCVGDFNNDGKLDIVAGPYLYLAPDWKPRKIRELEGHVDDQGKGYYDDFANAAVDVDGDGLLDVVSCSWFKQRSTWYRNPGPAGGLWPESVIENNGNFEAGDLWDLHGTGRHDVFIPVVKRTVWYELAKKADGVQGFTPHVISEKLLEWGVGVGDVNGDGRPDILRPNAWFEASADIRNGKWVEHPWNLGVRGKGNQDMAQMWTYDVNGDGRKDLLCSAAHNYGVFWYEQVRQGDQTVWTQHVIDKTWSQAHTLVLADLDGDGIPELIAGKRFMAHNGSDPGESEPLGIYYYSLKPGPKPVWTKHVITYGQGVGSGMNIAVADLNGDGRPDIVATGKYGGPVWFENKGAIAK